MDIKGKQKTKDKFVVFTKIANASVKINANNPRIIYSALGPLFLLG
jgi:hypothetical protein